MNAKQLKFLKQFASLSRVDAVTDVKALQDNMKAFIEMDFALAVDVWEFLTADKEGTIAENGEVAEVFADKIYAMLKAKNAQRTFKAVNELPSVRRAVFQYSPHTHEGDFFDMAVELTAAGKIKECDEIFKCVIRNEAMGLTFGAYMKALVEEVFVEILKKSADKRITMNKKMIALLLSYISKIKTEERPLLEQRLREIS